MRYISPMYPSPATQKQRGGMLIVAVFILLVLGALAAGLTQILQSENRTQTYEVFAVRATEAARVGIEIVFSQLFPLESAAQGCGGSTVLDLSVVTGLQGCSVTATCLDTTIDSERYYLVTADATCGGGSGSAKYRVERRIVAEAKAL